MTTNFSNQSVLELAKGLQEGAFTSLDIVTHYLDVIRKDDAMMHAFIDVYEEEAIAAAKAADLQREAGTNLSYFHGIPIAIKDIADIAGKKRTNGSLIPSANVATRNAPVIQNLLKHGLIILGVTHLAEFCANSWGVHESMGTPRNPVDLENIRLPGGSSSGSAVALAAGMTPLAVGTDTGGSVRIPASWCGVVGFKPTIGRISTEDVFELSRSLDTVGPMATRVEDVALLYDLMRDDHAGTRFDEVLVQREHARRNASVWQGRRICDVIGTERDAFSEDVLRAYDKTLADMAVMGAEIVSAELPLDMPEVADLLGTTLAAEGYAMTKDFIQGDQSRINETTRRILGNGSDILAHKYLTTWRRRNELAQILQTFMQPFDALVLPTTMTTAPILSEESLAKVASVYTRFVNFFNLCALAFPNGQGDLGLPTSVQLVGKSGADELILDLGVAFERKHGVSKR